MPLQALFGHLYPKINYSGMESNVWEKNAAIDRLMFQQLLHAHARQHHEVLHSAIKNYRNHPLEI
jgi:hypothetical protein